MQRKERAKAKGGLFEVLRLLRMDIAKEEKIPPFVVFADTTLIEMADCKPTTKEELQSIKGIGEFKLRKYWERFLQVIRDFQKE